MPIESAGIAGGMPGPVSRGDLGSIEKHMQALDDLGQHTLDFYRVLCTSTIALAVERGSIDEARACQFRAVLSGKGGSEAFERGRSST